MSKRKPSASEGIAIRHSKTCRSRDGSRCDCKPTYQAHVWSNRDKTRIRKSFPTLGAAKAWRRDALTALQHGALRAPTTTTLRAAAESFLTGADDGTIRNRAGEEHKPSTVRTYRQALKLRVLPVLGDRRLSDVSRLDVQDLADRLLADGHSPATVHLAIASARAVFRRAVTRGDLIVNPCTGVVLPAPGNGRERIVDPIQAAALLTALREEDRALWATALYAGLRRGELRGLRWQDVDLQKGVIRVERGWDEIEGPVSPKSRKGRRVVPIAEVLREHLVARKLRSGGTGLVFGEGDIAFRPDKAQARADSAWRDASLERITFHTARHTFASLLIAAGANAKAITVYIGHSSVKTTFDLYGHMLPGNEAESAGLLDAYLKRATAS